MGRFQPGDAQRYTLGVDRSLTEVAAMFLADHQNETADGAVEFLVEACNVPVAEAQDAVALLALEPAAPPAVDPSTWTKAQLVAFLTETGVEPPKKATVGDLRDIAIQVIATEAAKAAAAGDNGDGTGPEA